MNLSLLGFRVHDLNYCIVANVSEHVVKTGMGAMGSRKEASSLDLGVEGGGSVEVSGMWGREGTL